MIIESILASHGIKDLENFHLKGSTNESHLVESGLENTTTNAVNDTASAPQENLKRKIPENDSETEPENFISLTLHDSDTDEEICARVPNMALCEADKRLEKISRKEKNYGNKIEKNMKICFNELMFIFE